MSKLIVLLLVSLFFGLTAASDSPVNVASSVFNSTPTKVFDNTLSKDSKWATIPYQGVAFGAGTDNTTLWAYGVTYSAGASGTVTGIVSRKISAATVALGTDTTESAVTSDTSITGLAIQLGKTPVLATGPGYFCMVTTGTSSPVKLQATIIAGGASSASPITVVTASADVTASYKTYDYQVNIAWYEDGYFYILYTEIDGTSTSGTATDTWTETVYLQAVAANGSFLYTSSSASAPVKVNSPSVGAYDGYIFSSSYPPRIISYTSTSALAGGSNYTNSAYVNVLYKDSNALKTYMVQVSRASGTVGTAQLLASDHPGSPYYQLWPAGTFYSNFTYGVILQNATTATSGSYEYTYSLLVYVNGNTTGYDSGMSFACDQVAGLKASGVNFGVGYLLVANVIYDGTYAEMSYFENGTANGTSSTIGTVQGTTNYFVDPNGALWFGYTGYDSNSYAYQGFIGKLQGQTFDSAAQVASYIASLKGTFGNILASFCGFLILLLASLFAF